MNILHTVEFYSPRVGGAQEVVKQLSERLVKRGHQVTVATTRVPERTGLDINGVRLVEFAISGNEVRGYQGETERYQQFLVQGNFDVMLNYAAQQWTADLVFPLLTRLPYPAILAPCGFSGIYHPDFRDYFRKMPDVLRRYAGLVLHSSTYRDARFIEPLHLDNCTFIPNGAAEEEFGLADSTFRQRYAIPEGPLLLTVGSHTRHKGHQLSIEAFRRARIGRASLVVIGNRAVRLGCLPICQAQAAFTRFSTLGRKTGFLLDPPRPDVVAAFQAADLFVFGSNIECSPLVLFEAMASKTPFISVACGNAAEIAAWGGSGVIVPTLTRLDGLVDARVGDFTRAIERLWHDPDKRASMAQSGYSAWQQRFTWEKVVTQYEQLYSRVKDAWHTQRL